MPGYKYLIEPNRHPVEKCAWCSVLFATLFLSTYLSVVSFLEFREKPTVTYLHSQRVPIWEVPFPAVGICSINRISKRAAREYAEELVKIDPRLNVSWTMGQIRLFGRMYDHTEDDFNEMLDFQEILDRLDTADSGLYDMQDRMLRLAPRCEDILLKCQWEGKDVPCLDIFTTRLTFEGFCCTFNYVRPKRTLSFDELNNKLHTCFTGFNYGLIVVVNSSTKDYFYPMANTDGFSVSITSPTEYPDESSGHFHRILVPGRTEAFVPLDVRTVKADCLVASYSVRQRGCLFDYELPVEYGGHYSFTDCLIKCKIRSFVALCGCIPFNLPSNFPDFTEELRSYYRCNLAHIKCLHQYKNMLNSIQPSGHREDVERMDGTTISCPDCLPLCSQSTYRTQTSYSRIVTRSFRRKSWGIMRNISAVENVSIIRVFHPYLSTMLYKTTVLQTWQDVIAFYGGFLGIFIGFSLVSFMEIAYCSTYRLLMNVFRPRHNTISIVNQLPTYTEIERMLMANRRIASATSQQIK